MADKEQPLEEINVTGTSLVDRCRDELSRDSVRDSLSGLNERWGNLSRRIDDRADKLKRGISLAERYEDLEREFKSWLSETEAKLDKPVSVTGSTSEMQLIVKKLEVGPFNDSKLMLTFFFFFFFFYMYRAFRLILIHTSLASSRWLPLGRTWRPLLSVTPRQQSLPCSWTTLIARVGMKPFYPNLR